MVCRLGLGLLVNSLRILRLIGTKTMRIQCSSVSSIRRISIWLWCFRARSRMRSIFLSIRLVKAMLSLGWSWVMWLRMALCFLSMIWINCYKKMRIKILMKKEKTNFCYLFLIAIVKALCLNWGNCS
jgi:hypothetical protein